MPITGYALNVDVEEVHLMEETIARGTFMAPVAPANSTYVAKHGSLRIMLKPNLYPPDQLASEDIAAALPTVKELQAVLTYQPQSTAGITFFKRGANAIGGTPDPKTTFSLCFKMKFSSTQYYYKLKHCLVGAPVSQGGGVCSLGFVGDGPWTAQVPIYGKLSAFDTNAPTNWTFSSVPATDPLMRSDAGANPLTITVGSAYTPILVTASLQVARGLTVIPGTGTGEWGDIYPVSRRAMIACGTDMEDVIGANIHNATNAGTAVTTTVLTIKAATHVATLTGGRLASYTFDPDMTEDVRDSFVVLGTSLAMTG